MRTLPFRRMLSSRDRLSSSKQIHEVIWGSGTCQKETFHAIENDGTQEGLLK